MTGSTYSTDYPDHGRIAQADVPIPICNLGDGFVTKLSLGPVGYARPRAATPLEVSLVPAYTPCTAPDRTHGPPLDSGSCSSPAQASDELTLGAPDANGKPVRAKGVVEYAALVGDVRITVALNDVYEQPALSDYTGELRVRTALRITDKLNNPGRQRDRLRQLAGGERALHRDRGSRHRLGLQPPHDRQHDRARHRPRGQALGLGAGPGAGRRRRRRR